MSERYEVFARKLQDEALTRIGTVAVEEPAKVPETVKSEHGEDWLELVAIPGRAICWAIGKE